MTHSWLEVDIKSCDSFNGDKPTTLTDRIKATEQMQNIEITLSYSIILKSKHTGTTRQPENKVG